MKKLILALMLVFSIGAFASENLNPLPNDIHFEEGNFFAITTQFNNSLLDDFTEKVLSYDKDEMKLYFDSPGGSVVVLARMARIMKNSDIKFTCIASFAASAGFMLFQHCQNRLLLSDGILMSHNWAGGFRDEAPRILTLYNAIQSLVDTLEAVVIEKMSVDAKEYAALINNNLWMPLGLANKYKAIDGIAEKVSCSKELIKQRNPTKIRSYSFLGGSASKIVYKSGCPLIQKTYTKSNKKNDTYLETNITLFEFAQMNYKMGNANWIYLGNKDIL